MIKNNKGQAFVEAVFFFPIMIVLIFSVIWFAKILLTWQQLISATRYGTDMIANTNLSETDIKKDIENYLTHKMIEGRRLDVKRIKEINVDIKDFQCLGLDNMLDLNNIVNFFKGIIIPAHELSTVSIAGSGCGNKMHRRK